MIEFFNKTSLQDYVGKVYYARGQHYVLIGRVKSLTVTPDHVEGLVKGSGKKPYGVWVDYADGRILTSWCDCPVEEACKHVAALGLAAIDKYKQYGFSDGSKPFESAWRNSLEPLLKKELVPQPSWKIQIMVKLAYLQAKSSGFGHITHEWRFQIKRRLLDVSTGQTAKAQGSYSGYYATDFDILMRTYPDRVPRTQRQYQEELENTLKQAYYSSHSSGSWISVDQERLPALWNVLKRHRECGVEIVNNDKQPSLLNLSSDAVSQDFNIEDTVDDGIKVTPALILGLQPVPSDHLLFLGNPPAFCAYFPERPYSPEHKTDHFSLHPVSGDILPELINPVSIPGADLGDFQKTFLPQLSNSHQVHNTSTKITTPVSVVPTLLVTVKPSGKQGIELGFELLYRDITAPLYNEATLISAGKDMIICHPETEYDLRNRLENILISTQAVWSEGPDIRLREKSKLHQMEAARFLNHILPLLQQESGFLVEKSSDLPIFTEDTSDPDVEMKVAPREDDNDWFDLNLVVKVSGETVAFQTLFKAMTTDQTHLLLESGRYFALDHPAFAKLRYLISESKTIRDDNKEGLSISRFQAGFWSELQAMGVVVEQTNAWKTAMDGLMHFERIPKTIPPKTLKATLRPYQQDGLNWLNFLYQNGLGGVLADDMGLGKTIQVISLLTIIKSQKPGRPSLVVAPTSVVENWDRELAQFAPHLKKVVLRAGDRSKQHTAIATADVVIISYALLQRDFELLKPVGFELLILDESQFVKNYQSKLYSLVRQIKCHSRFALSGTPMENNTMELWSVFSIITPGLFPNPERFNEMYRRPIEKNQDKNALLQLRTRIRPFMLRRKKELVAKELPPKKEQTLFLELNQKHRHMYDLHLQQERKRILGLLETGGLKTHRMAIFQSLTRLRQLCLYPGLIDPKYAKIPSTKLEELRTRIIDITQEGHCVLVFSQFTSFLAHVKTMLEGENLPYLYLDGSTKDRSSVIRAFQDEQKAQVFLISLKSGGFGLNLTAADYCILLDPWWNPAAESQAVDRAHRIGQTKPVFVYRFIAKGTIEEKVVQLQEKKKLLFNNIIEEGNLFGSAVTEDDIRAIFE